MNVSIVICAYTEERWNDLLAAVHSVQRQNFQPLEIILVIDHNPNLFLRARNQISGVTVIPNRETRGLSGARNSGIHIARGEIIAFLDEDAQAEPDWLIKLIATYSDPQVIGAGGAIDPAWMENRPGWFPDEFYWVVGCTYLGLPQNSRAVRNLIGCNMSFRREVFELNGGFRNGIGRVGSRPFGCEETELCIRALQRQRDKMLIYEPVARVSHRISPNRARVSYFVRRCYAEGYSKAQVTRHVGRTDGLSNERRYTLHTLPQGIFRGLKDVIQFGDLSGLARAAAILTGLSVTTLGFIHGLLSEWRTTLTTNIKIGPEKLADSPIEKDETTCRF